MNNDELILEKINLILSEINSLKSSNCNKKCDLVKIDDSKNKIVKLLELIPSSKLDNIIPQLEGYLGGLIMGLNLEYSDNVYNILFSNKKSDQI